MDYFGNRYFGARYYGAQYWGPAVGGAAGGGVSGDLTDLGLVYARAQFALRRQRDEEDVAIITALIVGEDEQ